MRKIFKHSDTSQDDIEQERLLEEQWRRLTDSCDDGDEKACETLESFEKPTPTPTSSSVTLEPDDEYYYGRYPSWPSATTYADPKCSCGSGEKPQLYIDPDSGKTAMVCPKCEELKKKEIRRKNEAEMATKDVLDAFNKIRAKQRKKLRRV